MEGGLALMNNKGTSVTWVHLTNYSPPSRHMTGKAKRSKASVIPENMKSFLLSGPTMDGWRTVLYIPVWRKPPAPESTFTVCTSSVSIAAESRFPVTPPQLIWQFLLCRQAQACLNCDLPCLSYAGHNGSRRTGKTLTHLRINWNSVTWN